MAKNLFFLGLLSFVLNVGFFLYFFRFDQYPLPLILIHGATVVGVWGWVLAPYLHVSLSKKLLTDVSIIVLLCIVAFGIRLWRVDTITAGMWGDEVGYAILGEELVDSKSFVPFSQDLFAPPTPFLYLLGWTTKTLGRTLTTVRLPAIFFGALGVAASYIFLLNIYKRRYALAGSVVMVVLYHHIIISRFAYEMSAAVFFEFITLTFLYRSWKYHTIRDYAGTVLGVSGGLYTYLAFRTHALAILLVLIAIIISTGDSGKKKIRSLGVTLAIFFIALVPWASFSTRHFEHIMARARAISVFHQQLPTERVIKELRGNALLSFGMFTYSGDPNPRQNPAKKTMYDPLLTILAVSGLLLLLLKKRRLGITSMFLMLPSFVNDIFSIEIFPEFHYYGTGHPSATRVLGLIPIMLFLMTTGLTLLDRLTTKIQILLLTILVILMTVTNYSWYFNQPESQYIYEANAVRMLNVVEFINRVAPHGVRTVALSRSFYTDSRVKYFSDRSVSLIPLDILPANGSVDSIPYDTYTLIDVRTATSLAKNLVDPTFDRKNMDVRMIPTAWNRVDTLIVYRTKTQ